MKDDESMKDERLSEVLRVYRQIDRELATYRRTHAALRENRRLFQKVIDAFEGRVPLADPEPNISRFGQWLISLPAGKGHHRGEKKSFS